MRIDKLEKGKYYLFNSKYYSYYFKFNCLEVAEYYKSVVCCDYSIRIDLESNDVKYSGFCKSLVGSYSLDTLLINYFYEVDLKVILDYLPNSHPDIRKYKIKKLLYEKENKH